MSLDALIILSGTLTALMPFLGFPVSWDTTIFFLLGIFTISLGIVVRRRGTSRASSTKIGGTFAESTPRPFDHGEGR